ncbi:MAG: hypothetical protein OEW26_04575, partial [Nitrospirota bacterium]|nr:hypothetical protein [Nitrospirota bacterium]
AIIEKRFFQNFGNYRLITSLHFLLNNGGKKNGRFWVRRDDTEGGHDQPEFILIGGYFFLGRSGMLVGRESCKQGKASK